MDASARKTALRMIPYGLYVLTAEDGRGRVAAATVNWVTQVSFEPPLVVVGVKADSGTHEIIKASRAFALNILGKGQESVATTFFRSLEREGDSIGGQRFSSGTSGSPLLACAAAFVDCSVREFVERGDHSIVCGEVIDAGVSAEIEGRPDDATLMLRDLGESIFYGG